MHSISPFAAYVIASLLRYVWNPFESDSKIAKRSVPLRLLIGTGDADRARLCGASPCSDKSALLSRSATRRARRNRLGLEWQVHSS